MARGLQQLLSVRSLSVLLSATLILCSALITVYMGKVSNDAVAKTEDACMSGIDQSLLSAKRNVELIADKYMHQVLSDLTGRLSGYTKVPVLMVKGLARWMNTIPVGTLGDEGFQNSTLQAAIFNTFWTHAQLDAGIRSIVVVFMVGGCKRAGCAFPTTHLTMFRYATMYDSGYPNSVTINSEGTWVGVPDASGVIVPGECSVDSFNVWLASLPQQGFASGRPMPTSEYPYTEVTPFQLMGKCEMANTATPDSTVGKQKQAEMQRDAQSAPGLLHWTPPAQDFSGVGFMASQTWARPEEHPIGLMGTNLGKVGASVDVLKMGQFFKSIDMPAGSRVYGVTTDPWTLQTRTLVGSSHGATVYLGASIIEKEDPSYDPDNIIRSRWPLAVDNKTDPNLDTVVRAHGTHVLSLPGNYSGLDPAARHDWLSPGGQLYWTKVRRFRHQDVGSENFLEIYTVLLVERDTAMATVDAGTRATIEYIAAENKEADDEKKESENVMIVVVAVVLAVLLALSVVMSVAITEPLHQLEARMGKVAQMKLDGEERAPPPSKLKEVRQMQRSFQRLVKNLIEYRNYMPQSLLVGDEEEEEEVVEEAIVESTVKGSKAQSRSRKTESKRSTAHRSVAQSSMQSSASAAMRQFLQKHTAEGVKKKKCSFLTTGMRGFHDQFQGKSDDKVTHMHGEMISTVVTAVAADKGCADTFNGDRLLSSFGAVKPVSGHIAAACRAALAVRASCSGGAGTTAGSAAAPQMTCSAVGGQARVGNMGCVGMKKFSCVSGVVTWAYALERFASRCVTGGTALCTDQFAAEETAGSFVVRVLDAVAFPKRSPKAVKVYELMSAAAVGEDEWMYQLEEAGDKDPNKLWNQVVLAVVDGGAEAAEEGLAKLKQPGQVVDAPTSPPLLQRLEEMVAAAVSYKPQELYFH